MSGRTTGERPIAGGRYVRAAVLVAAGLFLVRVAAGLAIGSPVHPVTVLALFAGFAAALLVTAVSAGFEGAPAPWVSLWRTAVGPGEPADFGWDGTRLFVLYGTVAGGLYPWAFARIPGITGETWATAPGSVGTGVLWAGVVLVVSAIVYLATGTLAPSRADAGRWAAAAGLHLVYGLVFGAIVGLWGVVFAL